MKYKHQLLTIYLKVLLTEKMSGGFLLVLGDLFMRKGITYTGEKDEQQIKNPKTSQHEKLGFVFF